MAKAERDAGAQDPLFQTEVVPGTAGSGRLFDERPVTPAPVKMPGRDVCSDDARRAPFLERRELLYPLGEASP